MRIRIDPTDARPIWSQLEDQLRLLIGSGALQTGSAVPSVRDLARELVVNPATVSKAYRTLTDAGLLEVRRGQGTFVAADAPRLGDVERDRELVRAASRYAVAAKSLRARLEEAEERLQTTWRGLNGPDGSEEGPDESGRGPDQSGGGETSDD